MTTIAYAIHENHYDIATDAMLSTAWGHVSGEGKLTFFRPTKGALLALVWGGNFGPYRQFLEAPLFEVDTDGVVVFPATHDLKGDFHAVLFGKNQLLHVYSASGDGFGSFGDGFHQRCALGTGQDFAMGAMDAGKTPREAIELIIEQKRDVNTGAPVRSWSVPKGILSPVRLRSMEVVTSDEWEERP